MITEAHIAENWPGMAVDITIARRSHDGSITVLVHGDDQSDQWVDLPHATSPRPLPRRPRRTPTPISR